MKKQLEVIMLASNVKSNVYINEYANDANKADKLVFGGNISDELTNTIEQLESRGYKAQHLYFLSTETKKECDWVMYTKGNRIHYKQLFDKGDIELANIENSGVKKIVATTNTSLTTRYHKDFIDVKVNNTSLNNPLPQPSTEFIKHYVDEFNKGNQIKVVDVEYKAFHGINTAIAEVNTISGDGSHNWKGIGDFRDYSLKVNSQNEIEITIPKRDVKIEELAKIKAGIPLNKDPNDEDERYFNSHKCELYDMFLEGYKTARQEKLNYKELSEKFTEKLKTITNCPTCGSECNVEGDTTQHYVPKYTKKTQRQFAIDFYYYLKNQIEVDLGVFLVGNGDIKRKINIEELIDRFIII